ncbi:hypothetical protein NEOLEDRAFT_1027515, partial [Neolentinus lepideus HHB14362 ss-1]
SIREAAKGFEVSKSTLSDRYKGKVNRVKAHESQQNLSSAEELILVEWIKVMARRGLPMSASMIIDCAMDI